MGKWFIYFKLIKLVSAINGLNYVINYHSYNHTDTLLYVLKAELNVTSGAKITEIKSAAFL